MKKKLKSRKVWIVVLSIAIFLVTCGVVVYAANGFSNYKKAGDYQSLTKSNRNGMIEKIDSVVDAYGYSVN